MEYWLKHANNSDRLHFDWISHNKKNSNLKESFFLLCKIYSTKIFDENQTKTYVLIII